MTAYKVTRGWSENSVSDRDNRRRDQESALAPARDPRLRTVVQLRHDQLGCVSRQEIAARCGWTLIKTSHHLDRLHQENYTQAADASADEVALLTARGEDLALEAI